MRTRKKRNYKIALIIVATQTTRARAVHIAQTVRRENRDGPVPGVVSVTELRRGTDPHAEPGETVWSGRTDE